MRASMTFLFGCLQGLGSERWHEVTTPSGETIMRGNPSISDTVAKYMVSLHRRKVRNGEAAQSARAITSVCFFILYLCLIIDLSYLPE
jgi:hypothetical protein